MIRAICRGATLKIDPLPTTKRLDSHVLIQIPSISIQEGMVKPPRMQFLLIIRFQATPALFIVFPLG
jgi:hypothetical protein